MKHLLLLAALSSIALVSCNNEELVSQGEANRIFFTPVVHQTQARGIINGTLYDKTAPSFYAWAWYGDATDGSNTTKFMEKELVSYVDPYWKPANDYFWPQTGKLDFFCASPANVVPVVSIAPLTLAYENLLIDPTTQPYQHDLLYSDRTINRSQNGENGGYSGVPVRFRHALAQVKFQVRQDKFTDTKPVAGGNMETTWEIKVKRSSLTQVKVKGSLLLTTNGNTTWNLPEGSVWTADTGSEKKNWDLYNNDAGTLLTGTEGKGTALVLKDYHLVMPQKLYAGVTDEVEDAGDMLFTLVYSIKTTTKIGETVLTRDEVEKTYTQRMKDVMTAASPSVRLSSWGINKKILYTIVFNPADYFTPVLFAPSVLDWDLEEPALKVK